MKRYDIILVDMPTSSVEPADARLKSGSPLRVIDGPIVCMTIEEAKELWDKATENGRNSMRTFLSNKSIDFKTYLKSKGVEI